MNRSIPWLRIWLEMAVIVVSILLAFGIEAWWERGQERRQVGEFKELLRIQMEENVRSLDQDIAGALEAQAALGAALYAISPDPRPLSADSLNRLISGGWGMEDRALEVSALNRVLSLESFDPTERPELYRRMIAFRGQAERLGRNVERFVTVKMRTRDYMRTVTPVAGLMYPDPDPGPPFPTPIDRLLRDPQLESLLRELWERQRLREEWGWELRALAESIATSLGSPE
jgi:hypothetical protein